MFDGSVYPENLMQMFEYLPVLREPEVDNEDAHLEGSHLHDKSASCPWDAHLAAGKLRHADLAGGPLRHAHLAGAQLRDAHIAGDKLRDTHLAGAQLRDGSL
jgi:uncharacterized protein YjbI with pentapeptide repeats